MTAVFEEVTDVVVTVKVAVLLPAATVTVAGTVAAAFPLESATAIPAAGAAPLRVIVPVEEVPPGTLMGLSDRVESATAGVMVSPAVVVKPLYAALMVALVETETAVVVTANEAVVFPAATVTLAGTDAAALPLDRETTIPPAGAGPLSVTAPADGVPPVTVAGFRVTPVSATAVPLVTVRGAVRLM